MTSRSARRFMSFLSQLLFEQDYGMNNLGRVVLVMAGLGEIKQRSQISRRSASANGRLGWL